MAGLTLADLKKRQNFIVFAKKIRKGEPFLINKSTQEIRIGFGDRIKNEKFAKSIENGKEEFLNTLQNKRRSIELPVVGGRGETIILTKLFKGKDFGGGAGSGGGAEDTKFTESMQCYFCSYVFNVTRKKIDDATPKELERGAKYVQATKGLSDCWINGPSDWIESGVYVKTANKLWEKFGSKFKGDVYFHRDSGFMKGVYAAKDATHAIDRKSEKPQAPGSFSADKWNPGDIWASTFPPNSKPLIESTTSWGELNSKVVEYSGYRSGETKLLGISLKKIGTSSQAHLTEFNKPNKPKLNYKFQSYTYGKTGDFFSSQDIYVATSQGSVQFRTFGGEKSWQGEIKAGAAAGGKIGGGNVDFYCKQIFQKGIYGKYDTERGLLAHIKSSKTIGEEVYEQYLRHNNSSKPNKPVISKAEFMTEWSQKDYKFINSKVICMNFLDVIMSGTQKQRDEFTTKFFKYAQSDIDQSSYFVKIA